MKAKKSFTIILRTVFLLFSLYFLLDGFNRWDGYSFYMRFTDFLPELSLAFILWTVIAIILAMSLWAVMYGLFIIIPKSLMPVRLEYITAFFVLGVCAVMLVLFKGQYLSDVCLTNYINLGDGWLMIIGFLMTVGLIWFGRNHAASLLNELDGRISPLVWVFVCLLAGSAVVTLFHNKDYETKPVPGHSPHVAASDKERPDIILIVLDSLTARDMQVYGYHRDTTPFISEWAKDAAVFQKSYSSANWTTPGVMSMMTGQRPWTHRIWYQTLFSPVQKYEKNVPAMLRENGYDVYGFIQNPCASPDGLGIKDAFIKNDRSDTFWLQTETDTRWFPRLSRFFKGRYIVQKWIFVDNPIARKINSFYNQRADRLTTIKPPSKVYDSFLEYVSLRQFSKTGLETASKDNRPQRPYFAWLQVYPPHQPYLPPKPYMGMFGDADKFNTMNKQHHNIASCQPDNTERQKDIDILRKRHDEFIIYSDQHLKVFLSKLAKTVDMNNTVIILSSDHGESFSHGWLGHDSPPMYESLIHVPLMVKMPGGQSGKIIDMPIEQIDLAPTILEISGIPVPEWMEGRSLLPLIEGRPRDAYPVYSMYLQTNSSFAPITNGTIAVREGDLKLIHYLEDKRTMLFNTETDPDELLDLSQEKPDRTQRLVALIEDNLSRVNKKMTDAGY